MNYRKICGDLRIAHESVIDEAKANRWKLRCVTRQQQPCPIRHMPEDRMQRW